MKLKFIKAGLFILLLALLLTGLIWANYQFSVANPGGTDFLVHWVGARTLLHGETPYSNTTALEIQTMIYGRPARPGEHEFRVAYPLYSGILFGPFALFSDFVLARSLWMTFLEGVILATSLLLLRVISWQPGRVVFPVFVIFSLVWYHGVRPLINGNAVAVVAFLFVAVVWAIQNKHDALAGVLLALATIKPHLAILPILFIFLWTLSRRRWQFTYWFFGSMVILILAGMVFIPDWPLQNLAEIMRYASYNPPTTVGAVFESWLPDIGRWLGWVFSLILAGVLIVEWRKALHSNSDAFLWTFSLTLVVSQWVGITTDPGNFIILSLPLALMLKSLYNLPKGWIWTGAVLLILFIGLWALFLLTLPPEANWQNPIMFFPLPLFLLAGLYFCRREYVNLTPALNIK